MATVLALASETTPDLADEIATLAAHLSAATARLLALIAAYDASGDWHRSGFRSCAHFLNWRIGLDLGAAREHVRVAHALEGLPALRAAFGRGELSYSKVRAVTRIARPETEDELLAMARAGTAAHVERLVRAFRRAVPAEENLRAQAQQEGRALHVFYDADGMLVIQGRLSPEQGALVIKALEAAEDELHAAARVSAEMLAPALRPARPNAVGPQRRADALVRVAEQALTGGATAGPAERYQVVVHVDAEVLADPSADGRCHLEDGPTLAPEIARRLACDCAVVEVGHHADGLVEPGRRRRVLSASLRRALAARDGKRCVWPGCECCLGLQAHHIEHWAAGGSTTLENSVLVCARCHHRLHEGGFRVVRDAAGAARIRRPDGGLIPAVGETPRLGSDPVADLVRRHAEAGLTIRPVTGLPSWQGELFDCDAAVTWLLGAAAAPGGDLGSGRSSADAAGG